jgi:hypothetical protein
VCMYVWDFVTIISFLFSKFSNLITPFTTHSVVKGKEHMHHMFSLVERT